MAKSVAGGRIASRMNQTIGPMKKAMSVIASAACLSVLGELCFVHGLFQILKGIEGEQPNQRVDDITISQVVALARPILKSTRPC